MLQKNPKLPENDRIFLGYKFSRTLSKTAKSAKINTNKVYIVVRFFATTSVYHSGSYYTRPDPFGTGAKLVRLSLGTWLIRSSSVLLSFTNWFHMWKWSSLELNCSRVVPHPWKPSTTQANLCQNGSDPNRTKSHWCCVNAASDSAKN